MAKFNLTPETIKGNYTKFLSMIDKMFPTRSERIKEMYKALGEERLLFAPASSVNHYHNAIPGGYIDHVLRVMAFASKEYKHYIELGMDVSGFTKEELMFAAMHHDLGKMGFVGDGKEGYIPNPSDWHRKNQGKEYEVNEHIPFALVQDRSLFLLQQFGIQCSWNEFVGIRIHDGVYDDANKSYWMGYQAKSKLRNTLPQILHNADIAASRFEFERWNKASGSLRTGRLEDVDLTEFAESNKVTQTKIQTKKDMGANLANVFGDVFK
tara:strand:+ start:379 stop:1179 length:801 start_codon:yes stop_codon:yes gene_type:complete